MTSSSSIIIRPYKAGDEHGICAAHTASIRTLCAADYTPEQIAVWSSLQPIGYVNSMNNNNERFHVLDDAGTIAGFSGWFADALQGFYLHPDYAGQGLGRKLYEATEADYRAHIQTSGWSLTATLTAHPFYQRMGFVELGRIDKPLNRGGQRAIMKVVRMKKDFTT